MEKVLWISYFLIVRVRKLIHIREAINQVVYYFVDKLQDSKARKLEDKVLEVNSGVMVENYIKQNPEEYSVVKNVYKKQ